MLWFLFILALFSGLWADIPLTFSGNHFSIFASATPSQLSSQPYSNLTEAKSQSYGQIPGLYIPLPAEERGACSITDKYCLYNGTARNPDGLSNQCLLWDDTCSGSETVAAEQFFNHTMQYLYENICFTANGYGSVQSNCTRQNTPARYAEFNRIKSWMRSSQCIASQGVYQKAHPVPDTEGMHGEKRSYEKRDNSTEERKYGGGTCCGTCNVEAGNVDVYYWPAPDADTSCLSIIGNSVNPPDYGATTDSLGLRYWGCTAPLTGIPGESVRTITTASVMVTGSRSWKAYLENPWDASLCPTTSSASPGSNNSVIARAVDRRIYARGHTLVVPPSVTGNDGSPVTTLVSGSMTFTSPSIYAAFSNIGAYDSCGAEVISTTMLSFAPGELSTVVGPRYFGNIAATTLSFNFADLPCPPRSVASANYYKPAPGEPYRPLIAIPNQVRSMVPWFQYCTDLWFTGFDPPKTLVPAAAMAPPITTNDPTASSGSPQASATQGPGAKKTAAVWNPVPLPSPHQREDLPKETSTEAETKPDVPKETNEVPIIKPETPQSKPVDQDPGTKNQDPPQPGSGSTNPSGQSNIQSSSSGDPEAPGGPSRQSNVQDITGEDDNSQRVSGQDEPNDPNFSAQNPDINPAQVATDPAAQNDPQNQIPDTENTIPPPTNTPAETTISLAGHAVVAGPSGVHIDGVKINSDRGPTTVSGVAAILERSSIVVASHIFHLPAPTTAAATTIAGQAVVPIANGVSIYGTFVTGTIPAVIFRTTVSVDKSHLYIGSNSYLLPTADPATPTTLTNGAVALPLSSGISIYGTTLTAGAPAATISGTAVTLDSSSNLIFGGTAQALPSVLRTPSESGQLTTINSVAVQLLPSGVSVAGTTLTPGAPAITAFGLPISVGSKIIAVGSSSTPVSFGNPQVLVTTIGGQAITAAPTAVEIGSTTLSAGAPGTTISGTLVSLGSGGSLVVGSRTTVLAGPSGVLGGLIMGGFGTGGPSSSTTGKVPANPGNGTNPGVQTFEGRAGRAKGHLPESLACLAIAIYMIPLGYI